MCIEGRVSKYMSLWAWAFEVLQLIAYPLMLKDLLSWTGESKGLLRKHSRYLCVQWKWSLVCTIKRHFWHLISML